MRIDGGNWQVASWKLHSYGIYCYSKRVRSHWLTEFACLPTMILYQQSISEEQRGEESEIILLKSPSELLTATLKQQRQSSCSIVRPSVRTMQMQMGTTYFLLKCYARSVAGLPSSSKEQHDDCLFHPTIWICVSIEQEWTGRESFIVSPADRPRKTGSVRINRCRSSCHDPANRLLVSWLSVA